MILSVMIRDDSDDNYDDVNISLAMTDWTRHAFSQKLPIQKLNIVLWFLWLISKDELDQLEPFLREPNNGGWKQSWAGVATGW